MARPTLVVGGRGGKGVVRGVVKDRDIVGADHLCCDRGAHHRLGERIGELRRSGIVGTILAGGIFECKRLRHGEAAGE